MCGIFGYIGNQKRAAAIVFEGLKTLEYRGYDSWGIAVKAGNRIEIEKRVGKIGQAKVSLPQSNLGIGHTRWATHGGVTVKNAHPHRDCSGNIALLHNGIIENYESIKSELLAKGHTFLSETDTEVAVHLIEENMKNGNTFPEAVRRAFLRFSGLNAIVVMNSNSNQIIAAKNGSPLVVGKSDSGFFLASDASGIVKFTKEIIFLKDDEMVILDDSVNLFTVSTGKNLPLSYEHVDWIIEEADRGKYPHFMIKEIFDQPKVIRNIAETYADQIDDLAEVIKVAKGTFFIGAGTAFHASLAGVYLFSKIAKEHINTAMASEFNYLEDFLTKQSLIIALSQSGETIDIVEPLTRAKQKGSSVVAIVNSLGSTIYRMADKKLLLGAGPEKAVASTKAYVAKLAVLLMLSFAMVRKTSDAQKLLLEAAGEIRRLLSDENLEKLRRLAKELKGNENIFTVGRGTSYATALEAALKIKEVSYIHTEGLAGGELKHGTIALIEKGTPCFVFAPMDETHEAILSNAMEIKARGGKIVGISPQKAEVFDHFIEVKDVGEASVITQIIPAQLLAYFLAVEKDLDPDKPRNLAKSVTVK
ncbi:MAG: glutamine--fructose-6-phosphate transaminase (isomerizing) [Candidatus Levybacteria bacterium]|nr:glutamine--fructose-6-phosphate transaminase (isomerizing) [Candidatus Levybacteria bacterium]